jgi:hypothetical protein
MVRSCQLGQLVGPKEAPKGCRLARNMLSEAEEAVGLACVCGKYYPKAEGRNLSDRRRETAAHYPGDGAPLPLGQGQLH